MLKNQAIHMAGLSPGYFPGQLPLSTAPNSFPMAIDNVSGQSADRPAGGTAVTLGLSEIYEGFSRGVIDAAPLSVDLVETYKIHEVASHLTEVTLWDGPTWGVWMTQSAWNSLTPENQAVVMDVAEEAQARDLEAVREAAVDARETLKEQGVTFHHFDAGDPQTWQSRLPDFFAEWIEQMEGKGKGDAARQAVDIWREVVNTVECPA
ncbi:hypothetical protein Q672_06790 [Marinobacter sp. EVN1]|uniref:TRAP transporter substrate-binding protein DctP n=1 Tax=Marinobacter sp. EVN1 TaxID=1397532 RepID=UPI0003B8501D|nr:TRAP transporter substrate-binding protein DctP [Marinobacter sp. EVN1]ERS81013.1 hypothetical protein Q672_06790 [Marinobacter sp. EVN1]